RDAMLPIPSSFAQEQIDGARSNIEAGALETRWLAAPEAQGCRRCERDSHHLVEHVAVSVPAETRAWIVAGEQDMHEIIGAQPGEGGGLFSQGLEPFRNRLRRREACVIEIVAPAERLGPAIAKPAMESEWSEIGCAQLRDQLLLLPGADQLLAIIEPFDERRVEKVTCHREELQATRQSRLDCFAPLAMTIMCRTAP